MSEGQIPAQEILGTQYPYLNVKNNLFNPVLTDFRRSISGVNPFAFRQVPSQDRMAFGLRWGNQFYGPNPYPMFPTHYDPLGAEKRPDSTFQDKKFAPGEHGILALTADKMAKPCVRQVNLYRRCTWVNGDNCEQEKQDIMNVCPNWCLDSMREKTRLDAKVRAINNIQYKEVMKLSDYNVARTVRDISDKTWVDGTRKYLRPDTMYADERYANITQPEINEAKKRQSEKKAQPGYHKAEIHEHHYDHKTRPLKQERPLSGQSVQNNKKNELEAIEQNDNEFFEEMMMDDDQNPDLNENFYIKPEEDSGWDPTNKADLQLQFLTEDFEENPSDKLFKQNDKKFYDKTIKNNFNNFEDKMKPKYLQEESQDQDEFWEL